MATKLYFHAASSPLTNLPTTEQSSLTSAKNVDAQTVNRTMGTSIGAAQTSIALSSLANTSANSYYFTKFVSDPLESTSIAANTWDYAYAVKENNINANFPCTGANQVVRINVYVWRPSNQSVVGTILDGNTAATNSEGAANTEVSEYATFAGSAVSSIVAGDVIIAEIWFTTTQGNATARTDTFYFDGTTETLATGTTVSNHASFINTPETLNFKAVRTITDTTNFSESIVPTKIPFIKTRTITDSITFNESIAGKTGKDMPNVNAFKTTLTLDNTSGVHDQSFSGFGFQPKCAIFWGVFTADENYANGAAPFYGFTDGTNSCAISQSRLDNVSTSETASMIRNDACISMMDASSSHVETIRGTLKTFDSDGLTITWNVKTNTTQYIIHCMAFGGDSITGVKVAQTTINRSGTGNIATTGAGFQPDFLMFINAGNIAVNSVVSSSVAGSYNLGFCDPIKTWASSVSEIDAQSTLNSNEANNIASTTKCITHWLNSSSANAAASRVSMDSDGYTLNWTTNPASTMPYAYLAIQGGLWEVGNTTQPTSAGNRTLTPKWIGTPQLFFINEGEATTTDSNGTVSTQNTSRMTANLGGSDGTNEGCIAAGREFQNNTTEQIMISLTSKVIRMVSPNATATSSTTAAEADLTMDANSIVLGYTTADNRARLIGWWALLKNGVSGTTYQRDLSDSITFSESSDRIKTAKRTPSDTITFSESMDRHKTAIRSPATETTTFSETSIDHKIRVRAPATDSITFSESMVEHMTRVRTKTDTTSFSESSDRHKTAIRSKTDTTTFNESTSRAIIKSRSLTDSTIISDSTNRHKTALRSPSDTTSFSETLIRHLLLKRLLSDTTSFSESSIDHIIRVRTKTDTISFSETLNRLLTLRRAITDTTNISDSLERHTILKRQISDTISFTESLIGVVGSKIVRMLSDAVSFSESLTKHSTLKRSLTDTTTFNDALDMHQIKVRLLSDTISLSESITSSVFVTVLRTLSDSISFSESTSRHTTLKRLASDTVALSESLVRHLVLKRTLLNTIALSESLSRTKLMSRSLSDSTLFNESTNRHLILSRTKSDTVLFTESLIRRRTIPRSLTDTINLSESISSHLIVPNLVRSLSDSITFNESLDRVKTAIRNITDMIGGQGFTKYVCSLSDTITFSESIEAIITRAHPDVFIPPESNSFTIWKSTDQVKQKHKPLKAEIQKPLRVSQHIIRYCVDAIAFIDFVQSRVIRKAQQSEIPILPQIKYQGSSMSTQDNIPLLQPIAPMVAVKTNYRELFDYIHFDESIEIKIWRKSDNGMIIDTAASLPNPNESQRFVRVKSKIRIVTKIPKYAENHPISIGSQEAENILNAKLLIVVRHLEQLKFKGDMSAYYDNEYRIAADRAIRAATEDIYRNSANYGAKFAKSEYYTTNKDIENITRLAETFQRVFWGRVNRFVFDRDIETPKYESTQGPARGIKPATKSAITPEFIVKVTTAMLTTQTMKVAMVSKVSEIKLQSNVITTSSIVGHPVDPSQTQLKTAFRWITARDDRVCPICSQLEGQVWPLEESFDIPDPDSDTHPNCRCIVVPVEYFELP